MENKMIDQTSWMSQAACRGCDVNLFFSERGEHKTMMTAMEICNGNKTTPPCRVKKECLEWAISQKEDNHGIFGGLTPSARIKLRRQKRREPEPDPEPDFGYPGDNHRMYRSGRPLRSELPNRPLPTDYEWHLGLKQLVRLVHEAVMADENKQRARKGIGPIAIQIRD
jgi:hypothetical protein